MSIHDGTPLGYVRSMRLTYPREQWGHDNDERSEMFAGFASQHAGASSQLRWIVGVVLTGFVGLAGVFAAIVNWLG